MYFYIIVCFFYSLLILFFRLSVVLCLSLSSVLCLLHMLLSGFKYWKSIQVVKNVQLPNNASGCNCKGMCVDPKTCACAMLNGSDFPYVSRDGGR
jgi:hypothetical protein